MTSVAHSPEKSAGGAATIACLGAGQLGRMLALAGHSLGMKLRFLDPTAASPAGDVGELVVGAYEDAAARGRLIEGAQVVTYEFENVPVAAARALAARLPVYPPPRALEVSQDRLAEKAFFQGLGIPTAPFACVDSEKDLEKALAAVGLPAVLKTRRGGYDGKGQALARNLAEAARALARLGGKDVIVEGFVDFERELSILAVRSPAGALAFYPLVENHHAGGILRLSLAPAPFLDEALQAQAERIAREVLEALGYVGVLAIELFESRGGLLANEMAPRVHNSGHWTIEGALTSQFENHLRAVTGLPLGAAAARGASALVNLIGDIPPPERVLEVPGAHLHLYGKEPRPGRKVGHVTLLGRDRSEVELRLGELLARLPLPHVSVPAPGR